MLALGLTAFFDLEIPEWLLIERIETGDPRKSCGCEFELSSALWPLIPVLKLIPDLVGVVVHSRVGLGDPNLTPRPGEWDFVCRRSGIVPEALLCSPVVVSPEGFDLVPRLLSSRVVWGCRVDKSKSESTRSIPSGAGVITWSSDVSKVDCKSIIRPADRSSSCVCSFLRRSRSMESSWRVASIWHALSLVPPTVYYGKRGKNRSDKKISACI